MYPGSALQGLLTQLQSCTYISVCLSGCLSLCVCMYVCLSVCVYVCLCLSVCPFSVSPLSPCLLLNTNTLFSHLLTFPLTCSLSHLGSLSHSTHTHTHTHTHSSLSLSLSLPLSLSLFLSGSLLLSLLLLSLTSSLSFLRLPAGGVTNTFPMLDKRFCVWIIAVCGGRQRSAIRARSNLCQNASNLINLASDSLESKFLRPIVHIGVRQG